MLDYLRNHLASHGFAPTTDELATACQLGSASGAHRMLKTLEAKGYIRRTPGRSRAVVLVDQDLSLAGTSPSERYLASLVCEVQGAARDNVLRIAAEVQDAEIKGELIREASQRHELVERLLGELARFPPPANTSAGALTEMLGALQAGSTWSTFVVDHLIYNGGSTEGARRFASAHPTLQHVLRRVTEISQRAEEQARRWLDELVARSDDDQLDQLRRRAQTMLSVSALTARVIGQEAGEQSEIRGLTERDLPSALREHA